jgi:hypothetical protein
MLNIKKFRVPFKHFLTMPIRMIKLSVCRGRIIRKKVL